MRARTGKLKTRHASRGWLFVCLLLDCFVFCLEIGRRLADLRRLQRRNAHYLQVSRKVFGRGNATKSTTSAGG